MELGGIIVGLGNPGLQYQNTRHNLGFMVLEQLLDELEKDCQIEKVSNKFKCLLFKTIFERKTWLFAFPQTFMNLSGECVQPLMAWYKTTVDKLYVVHDELDLPPGKIQLKLGGGFAGHNGLKSIAERLATQEFYRLRLGIGRPKDPSSLSSYVLNGFYEERELITDAKNIACTALVNIMKNGPIKARNEINRKEKKD